ncbi:hypothetical protein M0D69_00175 [Caballeronia sp. SEWSISQ10-4 2]|uniref:hypothetical protein n=1 Tax=Caballeronia sp. SEWSISQ10-4 2 TaxID=2937438 RepID=UPI00264D4CD3|nr:hypothetical protein [Caballeronia sp. SEWSISQ10-4 2]MDN7176463.1 hypothetical protein [Caballeronia sp. SEWSISQ10-4 2]
MKKSSRFVAEPPTGRFGVRQAHVAGKVQFRDEASWRIPVRELKAVARTPHA